MEPVRVVCILALTLTTVFATDFYITNPYAVTKWQQDETVKITWNLLPGGEEISSISIDLMDGDDINASVIMNIASYIPKDSTCFDWYIPCNLQPSNTYFIRLTGNGKTPIYRFSHRFSIEKGCKWHSSSSTSNSSTSSSSSTRLSSTSTQFSVTSSSVSSGSQQSSSSTPTGSSTISTIISGFAINNRLNATLVFLAVVAIFLFN